MSLHEYWPGREIEFDHVLGAIVSSTQSASRLLANTPIDPGERPELAAVRAFVAKGRANERESARNPLVWSASTMDPPEKLPDEVIGWVAVNVLLKNADLLEVSSLFAGSTATTYKGIGTAIRAGIWGKEVASTSLTPDAYEFAAPGTLLAHAAEAISMHVASEQNRVLDRLLQERCTSARHVPRVRFPLVREHRFGWSYRATAISLALMFVWIEQQRLPSLSGRDAYLRLADVILSVFHPAGAAGTETD